MIEKEHKQINERHRSSKTPIFLVFKHEVGPYRCILAGFKPLKWKASNIPLDALKDDVENQLTLLIAGEEYLRKKYHFRHLFKQPVYGDVIKNLEEITKYRDKEKERFMTELEEKIQELSPV